MIKEEGVVLSTTASIAASADELSKLSAENWTEERHKESMAMLAKIVATEAALKEMIDTYTPVIVKLAQERGIEIEGVSRQKIPGVDGSIREVDVHMRVGETTTTSTSLAKAAIHAATGYKVEDDPLDPCVKRIRVNHPKAWGLYRAPAAAIEPGACEAAINNGELDPSCSKTTTRNKFGVEYQITDADQLIKGGN